MFPKSNKASSIFEVLQNNLSNVDIKYNNEVIVNKELMGTSFNNTKVSLVVDNKAKKSVRGDVIITHFGLSEPAILDFMKRMRKTVNEVKIYKNKEIRDTWGGEKELTDVTKNDL